ncbi:MAG: hypothetical protein ACK4MV_12905 [Beijerinckiaceae bacterium]
MAATKKQETRALSAEERILVDQSHHPALQSLSDRELAELVNRVRERRDRARAQARQQRREIRGKAVPKGASRSAADHGTWAKANVLANALSRLNSEASRRQRMNARLSLVDSAQKALDMKNAGERQGDNDFNTRRAHEGMRSIARTKRSSLIRPMERGRLRKAASVAQARRDAR